MTILGILTTFLLSLFFLFFWVISQKNKVHKNFNRHYYLEIVLIGSALTSLFYELFFAYSKLIWAQNSYVTKGEFLPILSGYSGERDGIEGYVLYAITLLIISLTILSTYLLKFVGSKQTYNFLLVAFFFLFCNSTMNIGFHWPVKASFEPISFLLFATILFFIIQLLLFLQKKITANWFLAIIGVMLLPICFISTGKMAYYDASFIFYPALKINEGQALHEIYFQYDLLLSLIAASWLRLKFDLQFFQVLGQFAFFIYFIAIVFTSSKLFLHKKLVVFFLISTVLLRYYAIIHEATACFQVTPLRLDLWLILVLLVWIKGLKHWSVGFFLGFLFIFHRNFGLIYLVAYYQLVFTLLFVDLFLLSHKTVFTIRSIFLMYLKRHGMNTLLISTCLAISAWMFHGLSMDSALLYQQLGIGMMKIKSTSIFWYFPAILSLVVVLLLRNKSKLNPHYFTLGLLLVFLAIGNLLYYFGRSHDNNLLNISGILLFVLFFLLDLMLFITKPKAMVSSAESYQKFRNVCIRLLPSILIIGICILYGGRIINKTTLQCKNLSKGQFVYPLENPVSKSDLAAIRSITDNSSKVAFMIYYTDFFYTYTGNYNTQGHYLPFGSGFLKSKLVVNLQELLNDGCYLITTKKENVQSLVDQLQYNQMQTNRGFIAYSLQK